LKRGKGDSTQEVEEGCAKYVAKENLRIRTRRSVEREAEKKGKGKRSKHGGRRNPGKEVRQRRIISPPKESAKSAENREKPTKRNRENRKEQ